MVAKIALFLAAVACTALASPQGYRPPTPQSYSPPQPSYNSGSDEDYFEPPKYNFRWGVNEDGNNFSHDEQRDDDNTQGSYSVDLPDGRRQIVTYYVDGDSGFVADVKFEGEARFPDSDSREYAAPSAPRPQYSAPRTPAPAPRPQYSPPRTTPRSVYNAPPTPPRRSYDASNLRSAFGF